VLLAPACTITALGPPLTPNNYLPCPSPFAQGLTEVDRRSVELRGVVDEFLGRQHEATKELESHTKNTIEDIRHLRAVAIHECVVPTCVPPGRRCLLSPPFLDAFTACLEEVGRLRTHGLGRCVSCRSMILCTPTPS
jgi:hypothetical protein